MQKSIVSENNKYTHGVFRINLRMLFLLCLLFALSLFIGARDLTIGVDTRIYAANYASVQQGLFEPGFQALTMFLGLFGFGVQFYFSVLSSILFFLAWLVSRRAGGVCRFPRSEQWRLDYLVFVFLFLSPFFVSAHINAIRQGLSSFIVFYAMLSLIGGRWKEFFCAGILAGLFHYSAFMYLAFSFLLLLPFVVVVSVVGFLSICYAFGVSEVALFWFSSLSGLGIYDYVASYDSASSYEAGIRYDFLCFSWFWVLLLLFIGLVIVFRGYRPALMNILKVYLVLLIPFFVFGFANYSNRYAYTAWLFLPIVFAAFFRPLRIRIGSGGYVSQLLLLLSSILFVSMTVVGFAM